MKLIEEQTGARITRLHGCKRRIAKIANLNGQKKEKTPASHDVIWPPYILA